MRHNAKLSVILIFIFFINIILCPIVLFSDIEKKGSPVKKSEKKIEKKAEKKTEKKDDKAEFTGITSKEYKEDDFKPQVEEESYGWMVFKTILVLGSVVAGFYFFLKFVTKKAGIRMLGEEVVQVLSIVPIGQNKYLQVVDIGGKMLVLGVADSGINLVTEITEKDEIDRIRLLSSKSSPKSDGGFQEVIMKQVGKIFERMSDRNVKSKRKYEKMDTINPEVDLDYLKKQRNRLKNLNGFKDE